MQHPIVRKDVVVEGFWSDLQKNEEVIQRCFHYLLKKYPDSEGASNALNHLLVQLNRMQILSGKNEYSPKRYKKGNHDKGRQQHLYKWVEKILGDLYYDAKKNHTRFCLNENVDTINPVGYKAYKKKHYSQFVQSESEATPSHTKRKIGDFPTIDQMNSFGCECTDGVLQDDAYACSELYQRILECADNAAEKKTVELRFEQELSITDIGEVIGCSAQNVAIILKRVRRRCVAKGLLPKNYTTVKARVKISS